MKETLSARFSVIAAGPYTLIRIRRENAPAETYYYSPREKTRVVSMFALQVLGTGLTYVFKTVSEIGVLAVLGAAAACVFSVPVSLSTSFGHVVKAAPKLNAGLRSEGVSMATFSITERQYDAIYADLNKKRPLAIYSMVFNSCAGFAVRLARRHGLPMPGRRFFENPLALGKKIAKIPPTENIHVRARLVPVTRRRKFAHFFRNTNVFAPLNRP